MDACLSAKNLQKFKNSPFKAKIYSRQPAHFETLDPENAVIRPYIETGKYTNVDTRINVEWAIDDDTHFQRVHEDRPIYTKHVSCSALDEEYIGWVDVCAYSALQIPAREDVHTGV